MPAKTLSPTQWVTRQPWCYFRHLKHDKMHPNNYTLGLQGGRLLCDARGDAKPSVTFANSSWGWGQDFDLLFSSAGAHQNDSCSKNQTLTLNLSCYGTNFNMLLETLAQHLGWKTRINACTLSLFNDLTTVRLTLRGATQSQGCIFGSILSLWMPPDAGSPSGASGAKCLEVPQLGLRPPEGAEALQLLGVSRWALKI